ncbi:hypothetical protein V6Z12_A04G132900 [Gossypium hirsutum]
MFLLLVDRSGLSNASFTVFYINVFFLLEAKKLASQYQKEVDKCNSGMETCEEVREKAEEALSAQMKLTAMWEIRARQKGWRENVAKSNAQTQGKTNYTRLQSKNNLQKAHNGWLLPLQMHVGGIAAANKNDINQHAVDTVCALNPNSGLLFTKDFYQVRNVITLFF